MIGTLAKLCRRLGAGRGCTFTVSIYGTGTVVGSLLLGGIALMTPPVKSWYLSVLFRTLSEYKFHVVTDTTQYTIQQQFIILFFKKRWMKE
jgi:hypothetical protein